MQYLCNKAKTTTAVIAIIVLMASIMLTALPVQAQDEPHGGSSGTLTPPPGVTNWHDGSSAPLPAGVTADLTLDSIAHMSFRPNPVGLGQPILVNLWMQPPIHVSHYFKDYTVTFTKPDGTTDVVKIDSYRADSTAWFEYTVDQIGTWKIKFDFPGGYFPAGNYTVVAGAFFSQTSDTIASFTQSKYYKPDVDGPYEFVVQQEMVASWPPSPLPADYWTRPVSPENREWWPILGNYPSTGIVGGGPDWPAGTNTYMSNYLYTPYVQGPNTAHIVWKRQDAIGGLIGGTWGQDSNTASGGSPSIVYAGRCYQTVTKPMSVLINGTYRMQPTSVWQCYDLRTGQVYWELTDVTAPNIILYEEGRAEVPGADPVFGRTITLASIGNRLIKYNPLTGAVTTNVSIAPLTSGTYFMSEHCLTVQDLGAAAGPNRYRLINWTTATNTANLAERIKSNISWPFSSLGVVDYQAGISVTTQSISHPAQGTVLGVAIGYRLLSASLRNGAMLMNVTTTEVPQEYGTGGFFSGSTSVCDQGRFAVRLNDGHWHCWDATTGQHLWKGELTSWPWGTFGCYGVQSYGGMIISNQYDGVVGYNWTNGKISWWYKAPAAYPYETPYQDEYAWFTGTSRIADGKLYAYNTEHTTSQPVTRGWKLHCINITTGEGIWNITGSMAPGAVADGYLTAGNSYDGYMYVFGKGKSATTVSAPNTAVAKGTSVLIQGTVLDQSPSQVGTPCVSEDSMAGYMEFLHMQKECPSTVTGVPVTLSAIKSDGTYIDIGATTTNGFYGTFSMSWTPPSEGEYTLIAAFAGDNSYGTSSAATGLSVGPAPESPSAPEVPTPVDNTMLLYGILVLVVIAILIGLVALLRKR